VARPVELPGSRPLAFESDKVLALEMRSWPGEHVAKCLVSYHPDDAPTMREAQLARLSELQCASVATFHEFLIEVIPPRDLPADETTLARALSQIYKAGIRPDWWKLPPPGSTQAWEHIDAVIRCHDPHCRGVLLLGLEASEDELRSGFETAAPHPICRGFAVGRTIFADAAAGWFAGRLDDAQVVDDVASRYARLLQLWREARAGITTSIA
jgi:5-dehydro-2-deoxygluconokinase